jgi:hypothetical protein
LLYLFIMKVIVEDQEAGIFIPFSEWAKVEERLGDFSSWMHQQAEPSVFEMSDEQLAAHLEPKVDQIVNKALANGNFFSVRGADPNQFIHQFADGDQELVTIDESTGKSQVAKKRR